jgi:hypothetical protein
MRPPEGLDLRIVGRTHDAVRVEVTARAVVHGCPFPGSGVMPCCERSPFEVPAWHRMTTDPDAVTCDPARRAADDLTRLWDGPDYFDEPEQPGSEAQGVDQ